MSEQLSSNEIEVQAWQAYDDAFAKSVVSGSKSKVNRHLEACDCACKAYRTKLEELNATDDFWCQKCSKRIYSHLGKAVCPKHGEVLTKIRRGLKK